MIRSILFVPADSERKLAKALSTNSDALVLDLEDSVLPARKQVARELMRAWMTSQADTSRIWVRVNDITSGELLRDLAVAVPCRPAGIVFPKIRGPEDLVALGHYLDALEAEHGLEAGHVKLMALVTETPIAVLRLGEVAHAAHPRVRAVTWGGDDLASALGASDPRHEDGSWRPLYETARSNALLTAHAMGVDALDTPYLNFRDLEGLMQSCIAARRDGFTGRLAIHPDQVAVINRAFTPSMAELDMARRIVAAFDRGAGAVAIDGKMYDIPHLRAAQRRLSSFNTSHD
ncbi:MAG TPA: CoA ester lyase [Nevskiaceae bacterium]|nr:CoA ester lyase [Nevskiaceae bacterium]